MTPEIEALRTAEQEARRHMSAVNKAYWSGPWRDLRNAVYAEMNARFTAMHGTFGVTRVREMNPDGSVDMRHGPYVVADWSVPIREPESEAVLVHHSLAGAAISVPLERVVILQEDQQ